MLKIMIGWCQLGLLYKVKDDAEIVVSTFALHPDHNQKKYECTRGMFVRVIDKILEDT